MLGVTHQEMMDQLNAWARAFREDVRRLLKPMVEAIIKAFIFRQKQQHWLPGTAKRNRSIRRRARKACKK